MIRLISGWTLWLQSRGGVCGDHWEGFGCCPGEASMAWWWWGWRGVSRSYPGPNIKLRGVDKMMVVWSFSAGNLWCSHTVLFVVAEHTRPFQPSSQPPLHSHASLHLSLSSFISLSPWSPFKTKLLFLLHEDSPDTATLVSSLARLALLGSLLHTVLIALRVATQGCASCALHKWSGRSSRWGLRSIDLSNLDFSDKALFLFLIQQMFIEYLLCAKVFFCGGQLFLIQRKHGTDCFPMSATLNCSYPCSVQLSQT